MNKRHLPVLAALLFAIPAAYAAEAEDPRMQGMHEHMQKMQEQMAAINAVSDPAQRAELMKQHHEEMHANMRMMGESAQGMSMEERMAMLEQRMGMMGMMMEHMMSAHQVAEEPAVESAEPSTPDAAPHNH